MDEFDLWNERKKEIAGKIPAADFCFHEREVWWCSIGKNIGSEQNGKNEGFERPVIVFRIFSKETMWVVPLTSKAQIIESRKELQVQANKAFQTADISQMRLISSRRLSRYIDIVSYSDFQKIRKCLSELV